MRQPWINKVFFFFFFFFHHFLFPGGQAHFSFQEKKHGKLNCTYSYRSTFWLVSDRLKECFI